MLRLDYPNFGQGSLTEMLIPDEAKKLDSELEKIDQILMDEKFIEPFIERFNVTIGRGSVPVRPYLRLMYLKFRYQWGYELLVEEVSRNTMLKTFCRIPLEEPVPDSTTLIKLTQKYGDDIVNKLNQLLIQEFVKKKVIFGRKLRIDTTVIESNVHYPTDSGLISDCVKIIARTVKKIGHTCKKAVKGFRNKTRTAKKQVTQIGKLLKRRTGEAVKDVRKITGEMAKTATNLVKAGEKVLKHFKKACPNKKQLAEKLENILETTKKIINQAETVNSGNPNIPDRVVSVFDPEARPIVKGKLGKKVEFGYKLQIEETENGFISGHEVYPGNPRDENLLDDALSRHKAVFGMLPRDVAGDRGYGKKDNIEKLKSLGVKNIGIPRRGKLTEARRQEESKTAFKRLKRWRAGIEGRINTLKRDYGLRRSLSLGLAGTKSWVSWGILAHNLDKAVKYLQ